MRKGLQQYQGQIYFRSNDKDMHSFKCYRNANNQEIEASLIPTNKQSEGK